MAMEQAVEATVSPHDHAHPGRPETMQGTGFSGVTPTRGLPPRRRRPLPGGHLRGGAGRVPRRRDPRPSDGRSATPGRSRATAARPARTARTPAASSGSTSSTRWRCSSTPPEEAPPSTSACWPGKRRCWPSASCRTGSIDIAAGDLGIRRTEVRLRGLGPDARAPTAELTSTSNCTTFQARRLNIRQRRRGAAKGTRSVATLNGTLATTRWIVADPGAPPETGRLRGGAWGSAASWARTCCTRSRRSRRGAGHRSRCLAATATPLQEQPPAARVYPQVCGSAAVFCFSNFFTARDIPRAPPFPFAG